MVDAHVHLWDPARADWYPYLAGARELDMGDISGMNRYFDADTYRAESAKWNVEKFIHVAAAAAAYTVDETFEKQALAESIGNPAAIVGGVSPALPIKESVALLDRQREASRFRGVRPMGGPVGEVSPALYAALAERSLVFDVLAHPDELAAVAKAIEPWSDLTVVIEHMGWPRSNTSAEFELWKAGMTVLAGLSDRVNCKLSGLAMPLGTLEPAAFRPWFDHCLEAFGVDRCMFASNFPVDGMHGTFDELYTSYAELASGLDSESRDKLFAGNAERVYQC